MGGREEIDRGTRRKGAPPRLGARVPFDFAIFIGEIEHNVDARSVGVRVDRRRRKGKTRLNPSRSATYRVERGQRTKGTALLDHEKLERELKRIPRGCGSRPGT